MKLLLLFAVIIGLTACDQKGNTEDTKQKAQAEEEASTKVQNSNLAAKAEKMEIALKQRHLFYSAVAGLYKGTVQVDGETYNIKINLIRSVPPYNEDRIRELSEIEADLNNLHFNVFVQQWHPADPKTGVSCTIEGVKPDFNKGIVNVFSPNCANVYTIGLTEVTLDPMLTFEQKSTMVAQSVNQGILASVDNLAGVAQPSGNAGEFSFSVTKVK